MSLTTQKRLSYLPSEPRSNPGQWYRSIKKEILLEKGRENLKTNIGEGQRLSIVDKGKDHNTREEIAKDLGWSTG